MQPMYSLACLDAIPAWRSCEVDIIVAHGVSVSTMAKKPPAPKKPSITTKANPSMGPLGKMAASAIKNSKDPTKYLPGAATTGRAAANALVAKKQKALMDSKKKK
jgi:hypothetical protein